MNEGKSLDDSEAVEEWGRGYGGGEEMRVEDFCGRV